MKSLCHVRPTVEGRNRLPGDLELVADLFEQAVGERCGVVTLEVAWESELRENVGAECTY